MIDLDELRTEIIRNIFGKQRKQEIVWFNVTISYGRERTTDLSSKERRNRKEHRPLLDIYQLKP